MEFMNFHFMYWILEALISLMSIFSKYNSTKQMIIELVLLQIDGHILRDQSESDNGNININL